VLRRPIETTPGFADSSTIAFEIPVLDCASNYRLGCLAAPKRGAASYQHSALSGDTTLDQAKAVYLLPPSGGKEKVRRFYRLTLSGFGFLVIVAAALGQSPVASTDKLTTSDTGNLKLGQRREAPAEAVSVEGIIRIDVTVTDQSGTAVAGLQRSDFKLLDNGQPQQIIAFRASTKSSTDPDDSLSVILLLDTLHLSPDVAASTRQQAEQFLLQNSGKLAQHVSIYSLDDSGFVLTSNPSTDGTALVEGDG
jgi:hypothetical protein